MNQYPKGSRYIGIFTCIDHKMQPNVGKYASPMDPMGIIIYHNTISYQLFKDIMDARYLQGYGLLVHDNVDTGLINPLPPTPEGPEDVQ